MNEAGQISAHGVPYTISHHVGNQVQTKNPDTGGSEIPENETSGNRDEVSRLGVHRDGGGDRSCPCANGDTAEVCGKHSGRDVEEEHESVAGREVSFSSRGILG